MKTEDKIGELIQKLVKVEADIQQLSFMGEGAKHPEMIGQYHLKLHEEREKRKEFRAELLVLKQMHRTELRDRITAVELEMDEDTSDAWDVEELKSVKRAIEYKLTIIDKEIMDLAS